MSATNGQRRQSVAQVGCGNIGSHLTPLLARNPRIRALALIDHDRFEETNIPSQNIDRGAIGRPKAEVLAARAHEIRPEMSVATHVSAVQHLPVGLLRADLIVACLDSWRARQHVNQIAYRLGIPWIDTAVGPDDRLARVTVFIPGEKNPCLECGWDQHDYDNIEAVLPCGATDAPPSAGPAALGSLAASLAAIECEKLLSGDLESSLAGKQLLVGVGHHTHDITVLAHNPDCLFDHFVPGAVLHHTIESSTLGSLLSLGDDGHWSMSVEGFRFARRLACPCGQVRETLTILRQPQAPVDTCPTCGQPLREVGFESRQRLSVLDVAPAQLTTPLAEIGLLPGDILHVDAGGSRRTIELRAAKTGGDHDG